MPTPSTPSSQRPWALVTGATGGIGAEFTRYLARHGHDVAITGRNTDKLDELVAELEPTGARVLSLPVDLGAPATDDRPGGADELVSRLAEEGVRVDTLVNNAGFGALGDVLETPTERLVEMLQVNVVALTALTRALLPAMVEAGRGTIITVASTASYQPIPTMATYAASKAYVRSFSAGLAEEVRGAGVRVLCINPGPTESGFWDVSGSHTAFGGPARTPADVVETTFQALSSGRTNVVDGRFNALQAQVARLAPQRLSAMIAARMARR